MGMEMGYWNNFGIAEKLAIDGKATFSFFIFPNIKFDIKSNLNFLNPHQRLDEYIYGINTKKAVDIEFGFDFYLTKKGLSGNS